MGGVLLCGEQGAEGAEGAEQRSPEILIPTLECPVPSARVLTYSVSEPALDPWVYGRQELPSRRPQ